MYSLKVIVFLKLSYPSSLKGSKNKIHEMKINSFGNITVKDLEFAKWTVKQQGFNFYKIFDVHYFV